jgi:polysaccharide export outer membrane protein
LDITVFGVPELSKTVQIAQTGTVNLPLIGEVPASGKTTQELERALASKLGAQYLQNPQVTVLVKEYNSQKVTVTGAVKKPGVYAITSRTSLMQIVAMAGDFEGVSDSTVLILRTTDGKRMAAKFDVGAIQAGRASDPTVQAGDMVVAGTSAIKSGFNYLLKAIPIAGLWAVI